MGWLSRHLVSALVVAGAACGLAPAAWAAPAWTGASAFPVPAGAAGVQVGYASGGVATLAWVAGGVLHAGVRAPGDAYAEQLTLTLPGTTDPASMRLAVSGDGAAAIAFTVSGALDVVTRSAAGSWGPASTPAPAPVSGDALGFDATDQLTAVWTGGSGLMEAVESGGTWTAPATLDPSTASGPVMLAVAGDGSAAVLYGGTSGATVVTRSGAGGGWSAPSLLAPGAPPLGVALTDDGTVYALAGGSCPGASRFPVSGAPVAPTCVAGAGAGPGQGGVAAVGSDAVLAWSGAGGVQGSSWPAGAAAPSSPVTLDPAPGGAGVQQVVSDRDGSAAVLWQGSDGSTRAAAFDGGGPNLLYADVPAAVAARQSATYSAAFFDLWSGVGAGPTWSFGDGTAPVTGAQVSHTYATTGTFTITVMVADGLGNATVRSFPVTVGMLPTSARSRKARSQVRRRRPRARPRSRHGHGSGRQPARRS